MTITPTKLYKILLEKYGDLNWWPIDKKYHEKNCSDPRFEIIIGAILTQNTAWSNVEKALSNLKKNKKLDIENISIINLSELADIIRPSGFFNQKANRVKDFAIYFKKEYKSNFDKFFNRNLQIIRKELLSLNGIGPETADSILLYAGNHPIFVVDAYTKRLCNRIPFKTKNSYEDIQKYFENDLSNKYKNKDLVKVYNKLHAQIVILAKEHCKKKPECNSCPLQKNCNYFNNS